MGRCGVTDVPTEQGNDREQEVWVPETRSQSWPAGLRSRRSGMIGSVALRLIYLMVCRLDGPACPILCGQGRRDPGAAVLRRQTGRLRMSWAERAVIATLVCQLPRYPPTSDRSTPTPATILRWPRRLVARRWTTISNRRPGPRRSDQRVQAKSLNPSAKHLVPALHPVLAWCSRPPTPSQRPRTRRMTADGRAAVRRVAGLRRVTPRYG
jgi:hypothetical protein